MVKTLSVDGWRVGAWKGYEQESQPPLDVLLEGWGRESPSSEEMGVSQQFERTDMKLFNYFVEEMFAKYEPVDELDLILEKEENYYE